MHALIVTAHPDRHSLTHSVAARISAGVAAADSAHTSEIADLAEEGFDPRFTQADIAVHHRRDGFPSDVIREQARIDRADTLVLVFPVYWWSLPALMKGWIDRVFTNGWAYEEQPGSPSQKKLKRLRVHLVAIGGADLRTYEKHGYLNAMRVQIDHGIFDYCGAQVVTSSLLINSEPPDVQNLLDAAHALGRALFVERTANNASPVSDALITDV